MLRANISIPAVIEFVPRLQFLKELDIPNSTYYQHADVGLLPPPIKMGERKAMLPRYELELVKRAIVAGASLEDRRALVAELVALRKA